jgi:hypothetical protein
MPGLRPLKLLAPIALCTLTFFACKPAETTTATTGTTGTTGTTTTTSSGSGSFQPVMWTPANLNISGFTFPEPEPKIVGWTDANDQNAITLHAWGIWTGLSQQSTETYDGQPLLVFETWQDPADLIAEGAGATPAAATSSPRIPRRLQRPRQFHHLTAKVGPDESTVLAFVKYDPTAAQHIKTNKLFSTVALGDFLKAGPSIPTFPTSGISIKPVFQALSSGQLVGGRYYQLATWPGAPPLTYNAATKTWNSKPLPQNQWGQCIWIDVQATGEGPGTGGVDTNCAADGSSRTDANTYSIDEFIHFKVTQAEAAVLNAQGNSGVQAGDFSALVAMHVTSREMTRWTWQTFWWVPNPDSPTAPSSAAIAALRPAQLTGAARNYAHCTAYSMENPPQPNTGGKNVGDSVYCFNPYLEAPFDPSDLPDSIPGTTMNAGKSVPTPNNVGPQTNCMACHIRANYNPNNVAKAPSYAGDRYTDLNDPAYNGTLKVDFLWSIPDNAIGESTSTSGSN